MRFSAFFLIALLSAAAAPARRGNTFELKCAQGSAAVEWISGSAFRFVRTWAGGLTEQPVKNEERIQVRAEEAGNGTRLQARYLTVEVDPGGNGLALRDPEGKLVVRMALRREGGATVVEHTAAAAERFYGLETGRAPKLDRRGSVLEARNGFLNSSAGYGEYYPGSAAKFDLASRPDAWSATVPGDRLECYVYYGPTPKEIFEEHLSVIGSIPPPAARDFAVRQKKGSGEGSWETLRGALRQLEHASLSATMKPEFDLTAFQSSAPPLVERAAELAAIAPVLYAPKEVHERLERLRARWLPHFVSYAAEARDRGIPILRPMAVQFPKDPAAAERQDQLMFGDEVLLAPVLDEKGRVRVYLPQGVWTDLRTNEIYKGRQEITVQAAPDDMPAFAPNGTIVPLAMANGALELHYFPKLGAEYFLYEDAVGDYSQFHAAPTVDLMRLEVESKVDREYNWVVHHIGPCKDVSGAGVESWRYDAASKNLHVKMRGRANADQVVHLTF